MIEVTELIVAGVELSSSVQAELAAAQLTLVECMSARDFEALAKAHVLVLGAAVRDPIQMSSQAHSADPTLSVVILCGTLEDCARIRSSLRFAPLIGRDVECTNADGPDAAQLVATAAQRTHLRRKHQRTLRAIQPSAAEQVVQPPPLRDAYVAQLMEVAPIGVIATDSQRRIVSLNAHGARVLNVDERELLGLQIGSEILTRHADAWAALLRNATDLPGPASIIEGPTRTLLEARAVSVRHALGGGYVITLEDITERVRAERERADALERAEQASRAKDEFLAMVSHELRTPLNAILGWARLVRAGMADDRRDRALETIERNALAQSQLIEDLLDITRVTTGKLKLELKRVALIPVIEAALETIQPSLDVRQIRLTCTLSHDADLVLADAARIQQVIWNLLSNATKFSPKTTGHIRVSLERVESHLELTVNDNGQGIEHDFLPHIFDSFRQADASITRRHGGLGLGLAITRHIIEQHGGTIHATSGGSGTGATFTVRLPIAPISAAPRLTRRPLPEPLDSSEGPRELVGLRVLTVDDELDTRELVAEILAGYGAVVRVADGVTAALDVIEAFEPQVLLSDIGMPGEDGYALIAKLRARSAAEGGTIPAAALTAYAAAEDRRRALHAGFQMHVIKPVDPSELATVVATLARMAKLILLPNR